MLMILMSALNIEGGDFEKKKANLSHQVIVSIFGKNGSCQNPKAVLTLLTKDYQKLIT